MNIHNELKDVIIEDVRDFDLEQTLECGQCFRFNKLDDKDYVVIHKGRMLNVIQKGNRLIFKNANTENVKNIWVPYFDLERDYSEIKEILIKDEKMVDAIREKGGVRLLNQEFHETLISYIISQNKQIPHIKKIVKELSEQYGDYIGTIKGEDYYSFPDIYTLSKIGEDGYRKLKTGFRAAYLQDASAKLYSGEISEKLLRNVTYEKAMEMLKSIKGVGDKVANCVLLFSLGYRSAFPIDVWIKRIMETRYFDGNDTSKAAIEKLAREKYGEYGGYAQQYLFCYGREHGIGKQ